MLVLVDILITMSSSGKSMNMAVSQVNVISSSVAVSQLVVGMIVSCRHGIVPH